MGMTYDKAAINRVKRHMNGIAKRSANVSPVWPRVGSFLSAAERRQFATEGSYLGTPWKPLKASSLASKARRGFGGRKILVETGAMRGTFTGRPMAVEQYGGNSAIFGSDNQIAKWQHFGTHRNGKQAIPPRTIMKVTPVLVRGVSDIIAAYILGKSKSSIGSLI